MASIRDAQKGRGKKKTRCSSYKDNSRMHWVYLHACLSFVVSTSRKRIIQRQRKAKKKKKLQVEKKIIKSNDRTLILLAYARWIGYICITHIYIHRGMIKWNSQIGDIFFLFSISSLDLFYYYIHKEDMRRGDACWILIDLYILILLRSPLTANQFNRETINK